MKTLKKIGAIILAIMMIAMVGTAWAATTDTNTTLTVATGEQGAFASRDTPLSQSKTLVLDKEIKAYNLDEGTVNAPTISYTYTISAPTITSGTSVTDNANKHTTNSAITAPVKQGIVTSSAPTIANNGVVAWTTADTFAASTDGTANYKPISIDFSGVVFSGAGVYRYLITEALTTTDPVSTYSQSGVTETTGSHTRYIDVYVRPASPTPDGKTATDPEYWDIYGYTCFYNNSSITDADKATVAAKTTGFVDGSTGTGGGGTSATFLADQYYTYNLTISKTVVNDAYAKSTHSFPFTVIFSNSEITKNILLKATVGSGVTDYTFLTTAGAPTYNGVMKIKDVDNNNSIKLIGIPMGTDVEVYETNDVTGTTYEVLTTRTNATTQTGTDSMVNWTNTTPTTATAQAATKNTYESTKTTIDTTKDGDDDNTHVIAVTNTLRLISPTGYVARFAPYALILVGGIVLLIIAKKHKRHTEEED